VETFQVGAQHQAVAPEVEVAPALDDDVVVDLSSVVGGLVALEVEAVIPAIQLPIDRLIAAAVEAVALVEIAPAPAPAEEKLVRAVEVQPRVTDQFGLPQDVIVVDVVVGREVAEGRVSAVVEGCALVEAERPIGLDECLALDLLELPVEAFQIGLAVGA